MWPAPSRSAWKPGTAHGDGFVCVLLLLSAFCYGCHTAPAVDTKPLDAAGMEYNSIKQLNALNVSSAEVAQIAKARQAGFSDTACLQALQIYRTRHQPFDVGDAVAGLLGAGASEQLVIELAQMNQLGLGAGELEAMRLAGLSDLIVLTVARRHAANQAVLSGASLAGLKNLGLRSTTLLELAQRGIPDSQASVIMSSRRRGARDDQILREFPGF